MKAYQLKIIYINLWVKDSILKLIITLNFDQISQTFVCSSHKAAAHQPPSPYALKLILATQYLAILSSHILMIGTYCVTLYPISYCSNHHVTPSTHGTCYFLFPLQNSCVRLVIISLTVHSPYWHFTNQTIMITKVQVRFAPHWLTRHYIVFPPSFRSITGVSTFSSKSSP